MKVKFNLYISDPVQFARDPTSYMAYSLASGHFMDDAWINCGEVEFDIDVENKRVLDAATAELDEQIGKHTAMINVLETRKAELLALPEPK